MVFSSSSDEGDDVSPTPQTFRRRKRKGEEEEEEAVKVTHYRIGSDLPASSSIKRLRRRQEEESSSSSDNSFSEGEEYSGRVDPEKYVNEQFSYAMDLLRKRRSRGKVTYIEDKEIINNNSNNKAAGVSLEKCSIPFDSISLTTSPWTYNEKLYETLLRGSMHSQLKLITDFLCECSHDILVRQEPPQTIFMLLNTLITSYNCKRKEDICTKENTTVISVQTPCGTCIALLGRGPSCKWSGYVMLP